MTCGKRQGLAPSVLPRKHEEITSRLRERIMRGQGRPGLRPLTPKKGRPKYGLGATHSRTTRKPKSQPPNDGSPPSRNAERQSTGLTVQEPPRHTRAGALDGPRGSSTGGFSPYLSSHHSHTFPCMS